MGWSMRARLSGVRRPLSQATRQKLSMLLDSKERQVRLADGDVLGRRVLVQLLVPLLDEPVLDALSRHAKVAEDWLVMAETPPGPTTPVNLGRS